MKDDCLLICSRTNYGLTRQGATKLAIEYAEVNFKEIPNSWNSNNCSREDWSRGFMITNHELSLRTPESTSLTWSTSLNKKNVNEFFENPGKVKQCKFDTQNTYNCNETGCTTVQACPEVIASKHVRQTCLFIIFEMMM